MAWARTFNCVFIFGPICSIKKALLGTKVDVAWAEGGPEHKFWPEDPNCKNLVTRFAKVRWYGQ